MRELIDTTCRVERPKTKPEDEKSCPMSGLGTRDLKAHTPSRLLNPDFPTSKEAALLHSFCHQSSSDDESPLNTNETFCFAR